MLGALALRESKLDELFTIEGEKEGGKDRHACIYTDIYGFILCTVHKNRPHITVLLALNLFKANIFYN